MHVFDRFADPAADITGELVDSADALADTVVRLTRHRGPVTLRPSVWVMRGAAFVELSSGDVAVSARDLAAGDSEAVFIVGRTA